MNLEEIIDAKLQNSQVSSMYLGSKKVWERTLYEWAGYPYGTTKALLENASGLIIDITDISVGNVGTLFRIAIGMPYLNSNKGRIAIYTYNPTTQTLTKDQFSNSLLQDGYESNWYYGRSLAFSTYDNYLIVGAPRTNNALSTTNITDGAVRILLGYYDSNDGYTTWSLVGDHYSWDNAVINNTTGWFHGRNLYNVNMPTFGWSVAVDDTLFRTSIFVSYPGVYYDGAFQGGVKVLELNPITNEWGDPVAIGNIPARVDGYSHNYYDTSIANWQYTYDSAFGMEIKFTTDKLYVRTRNNSGDFKHNCIMVFNTTVRNTSTFSQKIICIIADKNTSNAQDGYKNIGFDDANNLYSEMAADFFGTKAAICLPNENKVNIFNVDITANVDKVIYSPFTITSTKDEFNNNAYVDGFGKTAAFDRSGDVIAISSKKYLNNDFRGSVRLYKKRGDAWYSYSKGSVVEGSAFDENVGDSICISEDGNILFSTTLGRYSSGGTSYRGELEILGKY
jgi:hypothetical protein